MEVKNIELLELISKSKESINTIRRCKEDREKIKKLAEEIKSLIGKIDNELKAEEDNFKLYEEQLNNLYNIEMENNICSIKKVLASNLPNGIFCPEYTNDENNKLLLCTKQLIRKDRYEDKNLGEIEIQQNEYYNWDIIVNIRGNNGEKINTNKFEIKKDNILRVYKVISYIHDNLCYDE